MGANFGKRAKQCVVTAEASTDVPDVETMEVRIVSGPQFHSVVMPLAYGGKFVSISSEPTADGGSGAGINPMEYTLASIAGCMHEQIKIVTEQQGIEGWGPISWKAEFDVNLGGYMGNITEPLPADQVIQRAFFAAQPHCSCDQATIDKVKAAVEATCPMTRLFKSAGIEFVNEWSLGPLENNPPLPENKFSQWHERMALTMEGNGWDSIATVLDAPAGANNKIRMAEPEEDGGSGKGPNPMETLISGLSVCMFEQSLVIAQEKGVKRWVVTQDCKFTVNLDGFFGKRPNMKGSHVYQKVESQASIDTEVDQSVIDEILQATIIRCPVHRVFECAGVETQYKWRRNEQASLPVIS